MNDEPIFVTNQLSASSDELATVSPWRWACPSSSTGYCVYNDEFDECHDQCLVCGDPEERK